MFLWGILLGMVARAPEGDAGGGGTGGGSAGGGSSAGGAGGGAASGGAPSTAAAFVGNGGGAGTGAGGEGAGAGKGGAADAAKGDGDGAAKGQPAAAKYKLKRDGKELELTGAELAALASDDYEEELTIDKNKVKRRRSDLLRDAQLGGAAFQRMQEAAGVRKTYGDKLELLNTNLRGFVEQHLPADKPEALEKFAEEVLKDQYQLAALKKRDPDAYIAEMNKRREARVKAQEESTRIAGERKQRQEQMQKRAKERLEAMPAAFEKLGMKPSAIKGLMIDRIFAAADAQGYDLTPEHAAAFARDSLRAELAASIGTLDGEALLEWLGPDVVKKIRGAEVKRLERGDGGEGGEPKPEPKPKKKEKEPRSLEDFANPNRWLG